MKLEYGFNALNQNLNNPLKDNKLYENLFKNLLKPVRVKSIILDENHPRFKEAGEWGAIGAIEYSNLDSSNIDNNNSLLSFPLNTNKKNYPLINEIVYIIDLPNKNIGNINNSQNSYYIDIINIWNHPHHNSYPENNNLIKLGDTFKERSNIHPLLSFEGDIIYEGRWGNSIRFGSTVKNKSNNWSNEGKDGDPILIIRNGQGVQNEEGYKPILENINNDDSSIYICSTQQIPTKDNLVPYNSYQTQPISPSKYSGKQIILNSGRLLFNSQTSDILFNSQKSISLNSIEGVNIDTKGDIITNSKQLFLGSKNATEPLLLGNKTEELLKSLINNLSSFMNICSTLVSTPVGTPLAPLNLVAGEMNNILQKLKIDLNKIKSKDNYTI